MSSGRYMAGATPGTSWLIDGPGKIVITDRPAEWWVFCDTCRWCSLVTWGIARNVIEANGEWGPGFRCSTYPVAEDPFYDRFGSPRMPNVPRLCTGNRYAYQDVHGTLDAIGRLAGYHAVRVHLLEVTCTVQR